MFTLSQFATRPFAAFLGLTSAQIDAMFITASGISA